jgi:hypothetical protein
MTKTKQEQLPAHILFSISVDFVASPPITCSGIASFLKGEDFAFIEYGIFVEACLREVEFGEAGTLGCIGLEFRRNQITLFITWKVMIRRVVFFVKHTHT